MTTMENPFSWFEQGSSLDARTPLTPREAEVLELIASGYTNQEIARRLYLSINSVKTYIRGAYSKIGVTSRTKAVIWMLAHAQLEATESSPSARA